MPRIGGLLIFTDSKTNGQSCPYASNSSTPLRLTPRLSRALKGHFLPYFFQTQAQSFVVWLNAAAYFPSEEECTRVARLHLTKHSRLERPRQLTFC